jgi:hypothetical protein
MRILARQGAKQLTPDFAEGELSRFDHIDARASFRTRC